MEVTLHKQYPLQIAISTLFIAITVILALILSWQSFNKTSDIILNSADELYGRISQELILDFNATYGSISGGLRQFRLSPVIKAQTFEQRIQYLPGFKAVLASDAAVFGAGVGYPNGDYLGFSSVNSDYVREKYSPPANAAFIVFYLKKTSPEPGFEIEQLHTIYYDEKLNEVSRGVAKKTQLDPRTRPWYQQATDEPSATKPYLFFDSQIVGLTTMVKTTEPGVIVVFDITLENLSETIAKYQVTPSSEVVLINADGQTFAYKDQDKVVQENQNDTLQLASLKTLGSDVLLHLSSTLEAKEQDLDFEYANRRWVGSTRVVAKPGGVDLYALMISPVDELLKDAVSIRWQLIMLALVVLLVFIPIIWLTSKKISTPLHVLSQEADAISRFNFDETV